jgi:hypothetical protein
VCAPSHEFEFHLSRCLHPSPIRPFPRVDLDGLDSAKQLACQACALVAGPKQFLCGVGGG